MLRGLYAAASAMDMSQLNQDAITENLAHANVPGYRRLIPVFETFEPLSALPPAASPGATAARHTALPPATGETSLWGTRASSVTTDFTQGPLKFTGNPFDLAAANASTFFVVDGPNGPLLTRNGTFTLDKDNQMVTRSGMAVRGQAGHIVVPPQTVDVTIGPEGAVLAYSKEAGSVQIDNLLLANVPNPAGMTRVGDTLFRGPVPSGPPVPGTVRIQQGFVEEPNQQIVQDMVGMINGLRHYEAAQRALRALSDAVSENTRLQG